MKWAVLAVFGTIGLAALIMGTIRGIESCQITHGSLTATGKVVEYSLEKKGQNGDVVYFPVIEFQTDRNTEVRFRSTIGSEGTPAYEPGTRVDVLYDPRNPSDARIGSIKELWTAPITAAGVGLVMLLLSIVLFLKIGSFEKRLKAFGKEGDNN